MPSSKSLPGPASPRRSVCAPGRMSPHATADRLPEGDTSMSRFSLFGWLPWVNGKGRGSPRGRRRPPVPRFVPRVLALEDRVVPAVDVILEWNAVMLQANVVDHSGLHAPEQGGPTRTSRAMAIVSAAMFD